MFRSSWKFRPPPENTGTFQMCKNPQSCLLGNACTSAHSPDELKEWTTRRDCQMQQQQRVMMERKQSTTSNIQSIRDLINESKMRRLPRNLNIAEVSGKQSVLCKQNLFVTHLNKNKQISWEFEVTAKVLHGYIHGLQSIFFLEDNPPEFSISGLCLQPDRQVCPLGGDPKELPMQSYSQVPPTFARVVIKFSSASYGNFNATVIFDFGLVPRIVRYLGVVVAPEKHLVETLSLRPVVDSAQNNELAWLKKHKLVPFDESSVNVFSNESGYSLPPNLDYGVKFGAFDNMDVDLTRENYRDRLHTLLYVEEHERRKRMSRLNVHCADMSTLFRARRRLHSIRIFDAKKTLYIPVAEEILEEVGVLVSPGSKALLRLRQFVYGAPDSQDYVLHEALVINILSGEILVEISSKTLTLLNSMTAPVPVDICFRFVNTFSCMHSAIDRVNLDVIFYKPEASDIVRSTPSLPHSVLSPAQTQALSRVVNTPPGAPVLLLGPFGTGKTQTLAEAVKVLIGRKNANPSSTCRILICTHSNSAADHYIENYLHPFFKQLDEKTFSGPSLEKPLRIYWEHRLAVTISDTMFPYCLRDFQNGTFKNPTLQDLRRKTIVVTTLVTADILVKCGVEPGFFTHIFIDEAAQAMESEVLIPISLATQETKVVLAGDHLQLSPPVLSAICRKLSFDKSLLVRLYETSPVYSSRKLLLLENFRSYGEIVNVPSKLFYEGSLISKVKTPAGLSYPVKFYGIQGLEEKAKDSPSYVNMAEVAEVAEKVENLVKTWPKEHWGGLDLRKICVLCVHHAQVRQIRRELRANGFADVRVENVKNVQGLEFDVLFLSTVRTFRMLGPGQHEGKDLGFLSNPKLLNTAITRAKFSLVIVGDPKALCSVGDCRVCWKTILSLCSENRTFHYRVPLSEVLQSIRGEQEPRVTPMMINNPQGMSPLTTYPVDPQSGFPVNNQSPITSVTAFPVHHAGQIPGSVFPGNPRMFPPIYAPQVTPNYMRYPYPSLLIGNRPPGNRQLRPSQFCQMQPLVSRKPADNGAANYRNLPLVEMLQPPKEERLAISQHCAQAVVAEEALALPSGPDVIQTVRSNIATSLKVVLENEEAVKACIEQPLEDASLKIKENLKRQLVLIRNQISNLEQQQQFNRDLEKTVLEWQQAGKSGTVVKIEDGNKLVYDTESNTSSTFTTNDEKIDLSHDMEVRAWYTRRREDPIVQDYIKSFESLSERARTTTEEVITESCQIAGDNGAGGTLREWVLQPHSVVYASGTSVHEEHISKEEARKRISDGELVSCSLRVERSSGGKSAIGEVDGPSERNIYIPDRASMNRAFNTDYVAVMITEDSVKDRQLRHGKVVAVLEERHRRQAVCRLSSSESNTMIPLNNTNPRFAILQSQNHVGHMGVAVFGTDGSAIQFRNFVSDVQDKLFLVQFLTWDANYQCPLGFAVKCFNECSNPTNSLQVLCSEYGIQREFPAAITEEVNEHFPDDWTIPEDEREARCRYDDVFTIDVEGAEELDDAIGIRSVKFGVYCVAVHIADVSYFVEKNSLLDLVIQRRGASIYSPQAFNDSIPLLPRKLSHKFCSLVPGEERLAVSTEFIIDSYGKLLEAPVFRRSIVVSQQQFNYDEVDKLLDGKSKIETNSRMTAPVLKSLRSLHCLARELWSRRVRSGSFQASTEGFVKSASRTVIEEFMILTNVAVAERFVELSESRVVPLRLHDSPKYHDLQSLATWVVANGLDVSETYATKWLNGFQDFEEQSDMSNSSAVCVELSSWKNMCQSVKSNNMVDLTNEILTVHKDSPIWSVITRLHRLLPKGKYVSSSQYSTAEHRHFALNTDCYTHFTSPIRRYFDIVVHRVLLSADSLSPLYQEHEMETLCRRLNLTCERLNAFSKHCATLYKAGLLHEASGWRSMEVDSLDSNNLILRNSEEDLDSSTVKLHPRDAGVSMKEWNDDVQELLASWTFQDVDIQRADQNLSRDDQRESLSTDNSIKMASSSVSKTVVEIPADLWCELLDASRAESVEALIKCLQSINERVTISLKGEASCCEDDGVSVAVKPFGSHSVTRFFRRGDKVQVLFGSSFFSGLAQPFLQAIQVAPTKVCCVQHHRKPAECFARIGKLRVREKYSSVEEYLLIHIPLLMMESASQSVFSSVSHTQLRNVKIDWTNDALNVVRGTFHIPMDLLLPSMKIHEDDFVCVRTWFRSTTVVCHGQVHSVETQDNEQKDILVGVVIISGSESPNEGLSTVEIIPQCVSYRRMISSVRSLTNATEDVRSLLLRRDLFTSTTQHDRRNSSFTSSFVLDSSQKEAVCKASSSRLTLIQGSPGTGKTYTAAAIAEQFFHENCRNNSPPSGNVLLCCITNQAVDVAASMLSRFSKLRLLRIYGREIEAQSFPEIGTMFGISNSTPVHAIQVDTSFQETALHFRIRNHTNPFSEKIAKFTRLIKTLKEGDTNRQKLSRILEEFKILIKMAESYELSQNDANVIMCTCIEAGSSRIRKYGNIKQCIIDESNMCLEAASLVVLQGIIACCDRIVFVGDQKQLAPIVKSRIAKRFGLGRSLFQSLLDAKEQKGFSVHVLDTQYRMHPSTRKFCPNAFYDGQPKDAEILTSSERLKVGQLVSFWPVDSCRVMTYHVYGEEKICEESCQGYAKEDSVCNHEEVVKIIDVVTTLNKSGVNNNQIAVLTPYSGQEALIKTQMMTCGMQDIKVCSFIGAQGSEMDFVIISAVRSLTRSEIISSPPPHWLESHLGALADEHQTNVALTRARHGLIVIGNQDLLSVCPAWSDFVALCKTLDCLL